MAGKGRPGPAPKPPGEKLKKVGVALRGSDIAALKRYATEALVGNPKAALDMIERGERPSISAAIRWLLDLERERRAQGEYETYHIVGGGQGRLLLAWELPTGEQVVQTWDTSSPLKPPPPPAHYDPSIDPDAVRQDFEEELAIHQAEQRRLKELGVIPPAWHEVREPKPRRRRTKKRR